MGVSRKHTLNDSKLIDRIFKNGKKWVTPYFVLFISNSSDSIPKVAFIASKKVGIARDRNYAKRIAREVFRKEILTQELNMDSVFVLRKEILSADFEKVKESMIWAFDSLGKRTNVSSLSKV